MPTRNKPEELPTPEISTKIVVLGDSISVTYNRKYTFQPIPFEAAGVDSSITVNVPIEQDFPLLGEWLQEKMDNLQSPDLTRIADAMDKNAKSNDASFLHDLLSD